MSKICTLGILELKIPPQMSEKCELKPQTLKGETDLFKCSAPLEPEGLEERAVAFLTLFGDDTLAARCQLACLPS